MFQHEAMSDAWQGEAFGYAGNARWEEVSLSSSAGQKLVREAPGQASTAVQRLAPALDSLGMLMGTTILLLVTAFAKHRRETSQKVAASDAGTQATRPHRDIGPLGTTARLVVGLLLVGIIVYGQLASGHLTLSTWALGLIGFPALVLAWHFWRIRRNPARFSDSSALSFVLSLVLPLALYFTGLLVPLLWFTSDATLIFVGSSLLLAALRGDAGCEFLALSNWLLRRNDQLACAVFTPIDSSEQRGSRS